MSLSFLYLLERIIQHIWCRLSPFSLQSNHHRYPEPLTSCHPDTQCHGVKKTKQPQKWCFGCQEVYEYQPQVCLICEGFSKIVVVQWIEKLVICWCKVRGQGGWHSVSFPAKSPYAIPVRSRHMKPGTDMEEQDTLVINQYWLLLFQCLLHTFQLLRVEVCSGDLDRTLQLNA